MSNLFADDTAINNDIKEPNDGIILQKDLDALHDWEMKWDMSFHPGKCLVLRHSRSKTPIITSYSLHSQTLEVTPSTKYLGTIVQDDGEWREHVTQLTSKGNKTLGFLRRNMKIENKKAKEQAYMMLVRQPLEYASTIWDPHHLTDIKKIENIQRRAARFVKGNYKQTSSVSAMLKQLPEKKRTQNKISYQNNAEQSGSQQETPSASHRESQKNPPIPAEACYLQNKF